MLVRCHAGCDQRDLIAALQERGLWQATGRASRIAFNHRRRIAEEPDADTLKRSAAALAIWQASHAAEGTPVAPICVRAGSTSSSARSAFPCWPETCVGRRLACDGGARDARRHRVADRRSPHFSRPRWPRKGAGRSGKDDVRALSRWRCAPLPTRRRTDGWRRDRDLPCGNAGDGERRLGGAFDLGPSLARSATRRSRRDRARRWRRTRRGGGARLRAALEARGAARSHRAPAASGMDFNDLLKAGNHSLTEGAR